MTSQDSVMTVKEKRVQHALGTMFTCVNCDKSKTMSQMSNGGVYMIDNFCQECLKDTYPLSDRMILSERNYKVGYTLRREFWDDRDYGGTGLFMSSTYTPNGDYIGSPKEAVYLCKKRGIAPELRTSTSNSCSIGYSEKDKKYYGWSHRAICGFAIGDKIYQGGFGNDKTKFIQHGKKTIRTKKDQRKAASAFAASVS